MYEREFLVASAARSRQLLIGNDMYLKLNLTCYNAILLIHNIVTLSEKEIDE